MNRDSFDFDMIIIGAGPSGCFLAREYVDAGMKCLLIEAGKHYKKHSYPTKEIDANSQLYWSGGIELNHRADIGFLRPKAVGGGSIVNQALLDRFDDDAFDSWRHKTGLELFKKENFDGYYDKVFRKTCSQEIPECARNRNAEIFIEGFKRNGYQCAPLTRAQKDCRYEDGNDCIECLSGCRIDSKQSAAITVLPKALEKGLRLESEFQVERLLERRGGFYVEGFDKYGHKRVFKAGYLTLAAGSIGNTKILKRSGMDKYNKHIGNDFFTHPQFMSLGIYKDQVNAHKGAFQSMKSNDPNFRKQGFKLENVFGPPVAISMLLPGFGREHLELMKKISHMACVEVAIRDKKPGKILVDRKGNVTIKKDLGSDDLEARSKGIKAIHNIFHSTGAEQIVDGGFNIGLHLMGGLGMGSDERKSVVSPEFNLHFNERIFCADSSVFPNAPGINPSLTVMAMSMMAAEKIVKRI